MASELLTRAILVTLNIGAWSARKYDRKVTDETNKAHGAAADAGRYNKMLLPGDAKSYKALMAHLAATRVWHYDQTLPWRDNGERLLPIANFQPYTDGMRSRKHTADALLADFLADYPNLRAEAKVLLNGMYREEDYPVNVASLFSFGVGYDPVPSGDDFRVQLSREEMEMLAAGTEARMRDAFEDAHKDACKRLYDCVARIHERLAQPEAIFRDSLISNARELCDVLTRLNISGDTQLETLRKQTDALATVQPDTLRNDAVTRLQTANAAESILTVMQSVYGKGIAQ